MILENLDESLEITFRGHMAADTLNMWNNIRAGEENLFFHFKMMLMQ